ncbi:hypothetical protein ACFWZ3_15650 [Frateuria sp. GZRR35]|uniref:hypothetical protein n=1 Tax=unclassified Frateuria TaxID=2648894 RepID=UPI003EDB92AF
MDELRDSALGGSGLRSKELREAQQFLDLLGSARADGFQPVILTIDEGRVWIYEPTAGPHEYGLIPGFSGEPEGILVKGYEVRPLVDRRGIPASAVPLILSTMKVNQAFSRNTFTEILGGEFDRYRGNIAAIKAALEETGEGFAVDPLECLSAVEFETLVAKLFEADGCFVPAYRGGVMKDVDLYVYTEGAEAGALIPLPADRVLNVQLKLSAKADKEQLVRWLNADPHNLLISLDDEVPNAVGCCRERWITRHGVRQWLADRPEVGRWLERSLKWLPVGWRAHRPSPPVVQAAAECSVL